MNQSLEESGVTSVTGVAVDEITADGVVFGTKEGEKQVAESDHVILAGSVEPNLELQQALEGKVPELYVIGDCQKLGLIRRAIGDGASVACKI